MKLSNLSSTLILAALPLIMMSCGEPHDRDAIVNPKIEGKLIVLKNVEDITKNSSAAALYSKISAPVVAPVTPTPGIQASTSTQTVAKSESAGGITGDVQKLVNMVASADRKSYLTRHLDAGGKIGFAFHQDHIRIYALTTKDIVSKIASGPASLTINDIRKAKEDRVQKINYVTAKSDISPTSTERYVEVAALEIEKSGVLESEKTDYNETKPLLNIGGSLPIEVSTHVLLKQEIVLSGPEFKKLSDDAAPVAAADGKK